MVLDIGSLKLIDVSPQTQIDRRTSNIDQSKKLTTISNQTTNQFTNTFAPQDNRSLILQMDSPYANISKKDSTIGADVSPSLTPKFNASVDGGSTSASPDLSGGASLTGDESPLGSLLWPAVIIGGAIFLATRK